MIHTAASCGVKYTAIVLSYFFTTYFIEPLMEGVGDLRTFLLEEYCVGIIMNDKYDITSFKISRYQRGLFWSDF